MTDSPRLSKGVWINTSLAVVVAAGGAGAWALLGSSSSDKSSSGRTVAVQRGDVTAQVSASGNVTLPTQLDLAFLTGGGASPGTVRSAVEGAAEGGRIRSGGEIRTVPLGSRRVRAAFPSGARTVVSVPWGDVSTAYYSTGIPDITAYTWMPAAALAASRALRLGPLRRPLSEAVSRLVRGPGERTLNGTGCEVWGRARDAAGNTVTATLTGPNPYRLTVDAVLRIVERLPSLPNGFQTPSRALGADFAGTLDGVTVTMAALL